MAQYAVKVSFFFLAVVMLAAGCAKKETPFEERPLEDLYNSGLDALQKGKYDDAARLLSEADRQHPYSAWAPRAQVITAFARYKQRRLDQAIGDLETFLQLHPGHEYAPYALYLQGQCAFEQMPSVDRDPQGMDLCLRIFGDLVRRFPSTPWARDARLKMTMMRDHAAARELQVARFYQTTQQHAAALLRLYRIVQDYQDTTQIAEALYREVECYLALGLPEDARRPAAVLGHNYPGSLWYKKAFDKMARVPAPGPAGEDRKTPRSGRA